MSEIEFEDTESLGGAGTLVSDTEPASSRIREPFGPLRALRHRNYRLFFGGQIISLCGTWIQQVAHGWLVYQLTNSELMLGVVGSIGALPILLFSLPAGVAADRFHKRNVLVATQTGAMLLALTLGTLVYLDVIAIYHIMIIGFLLGIVNAFDATARHSFVIEMVGKRDLPHAIGLNSAMFNSARIIGPAVAGIVIAAAGMAGAFFANGISYLAVILGLSLIRLDGAAPAANHDTVGDGFREGLRFVRKHRTITALLVLTMAMSIFGASYAVLMPVFAKKILHAQVGGLGYLMSCVGIGALIGAITVSCLGDLKAKGKYLLVGNLTFCTMLVLFSFSRTMPLSMALLLGVGWGMTTSMSLINTLIQTCAPDHLRGRVMSIYIMTFLGMGPIGNLQAGFVASHLGAPAAVRLGAIICATTALVLSPRLIRHRS